MIERVVFKNNDLEEALLQIKYVLNKLVDIYNEQEKLEESYFEQPEKAD